MKIVITGSLGHIGQPLAETLLAQGHQLTIISSSPDKQAVIEALGARAAIGKVTDADFLTDAFKEANAVYCMVPPNFSETDQIAYYSNVGRSYAQAIGEANVKRVVHLSSYGAHLESGTGFITGSNRVEGLLNALPQVQVTHVRPGFFYYNLMNFIGMIKGSGAMAANYGGNDRLGMVAPVDIAAVVAEELTTSYPQTIRYVLSDDRTCAEVARVLGNAIGVPALQWNTLTNEQMQQGLEAHGMLPATAAKLTELGAAIHSGMLREDLDKHYEVVGKVRLEDFAPVFAAAFNRKQ